MIDWKPNAKVIADSISPTGVRLTTFECEMHRFVLPEFNTHRMFSRNSASSRAIPYPKMRAKALESTAYPVSWPAEQKGMQGGEEIDADFNSVWRSALVSAVNEADQLFEMGLHKSVINRLLEPFIPHKVIVSATEWDGFFAQRLHPDAQPEIHELAKAMKVAMDESTPTALVYGGWHKPYIYKEDEELAFLHLGTIAEEYGLTITNDVLCAISAARCARVSYLTHDLKRDIFADLDLYRRLKDHVPAHASPFEHVATPIEPMYAAGGNFRGWVQLRSKLGLS